MTREEFESIQKEHMKLEADILRSEAQQMKLLNSLKGQNVYWPDGYGGFASGTVVSGGIGKCLRVVSDGIGYNLPPHRLKFVDENVEMTE